MHRLIVANCYPPKIAAKQGQRARENADPIYDFMNLEMISAHEIQCKIYKIMADIMQWNHAMISFLEKYDIITDIQNMNIIYDFMIPWNHIMI